MDTDVDKTLKFFNDVVSWVVWHFKIAVFRFFSLLYQNASKNKCDM